MIIATKNTIFKPSLVDIFMSFVHFGFKDNLYSPIW